MTTRSDAPERQRERQRQEAMHPEPPGAAFNAQARRAHARAREADDTTPDTTDSDARPLRPATALAGRALRFLDKQAFMRKTPASPSELWRRVRMRGADLEGWLLIAALYVLGACCYAVTAVMFAPAWFFLLGFGGGDIRPLADLRSEAATVIAHRTNRWAAGALATGYATVWCAVAACYAVAYIAQFPALLVLLSICSSIAFLTSLF